VRRCSVLGLERPGDWIYASTSAEAGSLELAAGWTEGNDYRGFSVIACRWGAQGRLTTELVGGRIRTSNEQ